MWEGGHLNGSNPHEDALRCGAAQGACSIYHAIEALNYEDMMGVREDVSDEGNPDGRV